MKILVVEDEHRIAQAIKKGLEQERFTVDLAYDGEQGLDFILSESYDCLVLDLMLPKLSGLDLVTETRSHKIHTPILILTAKDSTSDKVEGLNLGADDYLGKPFAFDELVARIRALTRRTPSPIHSILSFKNLSLDPQRLQATLRGKPLNLSRKEFSLLEYFLRHPHQLISKQRLISQVWDYEADILENTVEVNIRNLRKKIGKDLIETKRGFGYRLGGEK